MKMDLGAQARRFITVGSINTLISYLLYAFFLWLGLHYTIAAFLGACISIVINYFTIGLGVFDSRDNMNAKRFILFVISNAGNYFVGIISIWSFIQFDINEYIAGLLAVFPVACFSFTVNKYIVFRPAKK